MCQSDASLLGTAVLAKQTEVVDMLLYSKADPEVMMLEVLTPLFSHAHNTGLWQMNNASAILLASISGATDAASLLIQAKADVSAKDMVYSNHCVMLNLNLCLLLVLRLIS